MGTNFCELEPQFAREPLEGSTMASAGTLSNFLYQVKIVPGESVDLAEEIFTILKETVMKNEEVRR